MDFKFSKRILQNYVHSIHGYFEFCLVYAVYSNNEIVGTFLLSEKVGFLDFANSNFRIDIRHHVFKSDEYAIVDSNNETRIGEYLLPLRLDGSMKLGRLRLNGKEYACKKLKPDIHYSPFKKSTWGHYKVKVFNDETDVIYKLKMDVPVMDLPNTSQRPFNGEIQMNTDKLLVLFCGLFLLEQIFEIRDSQMT